jgi:hypothetical protein
MLLDETFDQISSLAFQKRGHTDDKSISGAEFLTDSSSRNRANECGEANERQHCVSEELN